MAASFLTDTAEWMPLARVKLGVDATELPDAVLNNAILIELAEKRVKDKLNSWATHFAANPGTVKMAAICFLAANFCDSMAVTILAMEQEGPYRAQRQQVDWQARKTDLIGEALGHLNTLDSSISLYPEAIAIISPATPLFGTV